MLIYSKLLTVIGTLNIILCFGFSIYYNVNPTAFTQETLINSLASTIGFFAFFVMMIIAVFGHRMNIYPMALE